MRIDNVRCRIISVGDVTEKNGFKKSIVRVETRELTNDFQEVIAKAELFDCEVINPSTNKFPELQEAVKSTDLYLPCTFNLRAFTYKEKGEDKLGRALELKRWWR